MACSNVDKTLRKFFHWLGFNIGHTPGYFVIVPILLTALLATGFQQMDYNYDPEYLFSPTGGDAKYERQIVEDLFPTNFTDFKASRITRPGKFGRVIVASKDGGSMLRSHLWNQLLYLDQVIYNVSVPHEGNTLKYAQLCAQWNSYCYDNEILRMASLIPDVESGEIKITYPIFFDPYTFETYTLPIFFGGIDLNSDEVTVKSVQAVGLSYFLDASEDWLEKVGDQWERKFLQDVEKFSNLYPDLKVGMFVSNTPAWEMENSKLSVTKLLCFNVGMMVIFSFISAYTSDATKSKPWVAFFGLFSACLATLAGFGFCCYIGVEWVTLNLAAPFLLFGIGFDDTFVMLSAWRRSSSHLSVPERMGRTYADAGVSITFTSLTNIFSCLMSCMTPFPCIRIFCIYTGVAMAFTYIWHITMFGAILALAGRAEAVNRHGLILCKKVTPRSQSQKKSWFYQNFLSGGINPEDPMNPLDNQEHAGMAFFRDKMGNWLNIGWVKAIILTIFTGYLVGGIWGVTQIQEGLEKKNTANFDSYSVQFYDLDDKYFKKYGFTISVVFSGPNLDFSSIKTQNRIETIVQAFESSVYIDANLTQNWLRDFLDYVDRNKGYADVQLPIQTEQEFAQTLKNVYLADPNNPARLDVTFSQDGQKVEAARFLIQGLNIINSKIEQNMVADLREICARYSTDELQVTVFQPFFIYIDQYLAILPQTLQTIFVTAAVMVLISMLLIPNLACALWVSFSIVSIEIGVVGYMTWWGVRLDGVALINLIMCIGFSVDFSAHICYHYLTAVSEDGIVENNISLTGRPEDRIKASLYALGIPILQGAFSTILGVFGLAFAPSYIFVTFFKMIFLVIMLGVFHGMILLPVLLSLMGPGSCASKSRTSNSGSCKKTSTRSSGLSTPTLNAITCHRDHKSIESQDSCYTINLGYVSHEEPSQFVPYHYHQYLQRQNYSMQVQQVHPQEQINNSTTSSPSTSSSSSQNRSHGLHHRRRHHHHKTHHGHKKKHKSASKVQHVHPVHIVEALTNGVDLVYKESPSPTSAQSEHNRQIHLAAISRITQQRSNLNGNQHKKVGRSRSHHPVLNAPTMVSTVPEGLILSMDHTSKPVLRKHHSFPYEMFNNETSYSSDDSLRN